MKGVIMAAISVKRQRLDSLDKDQGAHHLNYSIDPLFHIWDIAAVLHQKQRIYTLIDSFFSDQTIEMIQRIYTYQVIQHGEFEETVFTEESLIALLIEKTKESGDPLAYLSSLTMLWKCGKISPSAIPYFFAAGLLATEVNHPGIAKKTLDTHKHIVQSAFTRLHGGIHLPFSTKAHTVKNFTALFSTLATFYEEKFITLKVYKICLNYLSKSHFIVDKESFSALATLFNNLPSYISLHIAFYKCIAQNIGKSEIQQKLLNAFIQKVKPSPLYILIMMKQLITAHSYNSVLVPPADGIIQEIKQSFIKTCLTSTPNGEIDESFCRVDSFLFYNLGPCILNDAPVRASLFIYFANGCPTKKEAKKLLLLISELYQKKHWLLSPWRDQGTLLSRTKAMSITQQFFNDIFSFNNEKTDFITLILDEIEMVKFKPWHTIDFFIAYVIFCNNCASHSETHEKFLITQIKRVIEMLSIPIENRKIQKTILSLLKTAVPHAFYPST